MRLLIYLLALISGFSAADAARAEVSTASSVAQTAVAAAEALVAQEQAAAVPQPVNRLHGIAAIETNAAPVASNANTPVSRHDLSRE
jgi:hypothetical protein